MKLKMFSLEYLAFLCDLTTIGGLMPLADVEEEESSLPHHRHLLRNNGGPRTIIYGILIVLAVIFVLITIWVVFFRSEWFVIPCRELGRGRKSYLPESWTFDDIPDRVWGRVDQRSSRKAACMKHKRNFCERCGEDYTILNVLCKDYSYLNSNNETDFRMSVIRELMLHCYKEDSQRDEETGSYPAISHGWERTLAQTAFRLLNETEDPVLLISGFANYCYRLLKSPTMHLDESSFQLADKAAQELLRIRENPKAVEQNRKLHRMTVSEPTDHTTISVEQIAMFSAREDLNNGAQKQEEQEC